MAVNKLASAQLLVAVDILFSLFAISSGTMVLTMLAEQEERVREKIEICHATGATENPYVHASVAKTHNAAGHANPSHQGGNDIIPPFSYSEGIFPGQNWNTEGQIIWNNGCSIPPPAPPSTPQEQQPPSEEIQEPPATELPPSETLPPPSPSEPLPSQPPPSDSTAPVASISSPVNNATLSGTTTIIADASDNVGVTQVDFFIDNTLAGSDASFSYSFFWDTTTYSNGTHTLFVKAYDAAGNSGTSATVSVTVNNVSGGGDGGGSQIMRQPVFRLYHPAVVDHFYTASLIERDNAIQTGYISEGTGFYAYGSQASGTTPAFRLFHPQTGNHFYTLSITERDNAVQNGYRYEGIAFYAYGSQASGTIPVFRLFHLSENDHFYTTSISERDAAIQTGYISEGTGFFAWSS